MKPSLSQHVLPCLAAAFFGLIATSSAQYLNGQAAFTVLGQPDFSTNTGLNPPTQSSLTAPRFVAIDKATGKFFVADSGSNRILRFPSTAAFFSGQVAEAVFGQSTFTTRAAATTAAGLNTPIGVALDATGSLWIADFNNNRVLKIPSATTAASGAAATVALGQSGLTTGSPGLASNLLDHPTTVALDSSGNLYVSDSNNNRVLRFADASSLTTGASAVAAFGQISAGVKTPGLSASGLNFPYGITTDSSGNLWVADFGNNRVVRFASSATAATGSSANLVVGQTSFTTNTSGVSASTLSSPVGVTLDPLNRLYISDFGNNRVAMYQPSDLSANGASMSVVLGQPDFTSNSINPVSATSLSSPFGLSYLSSGYLFVADGNNNRLLIYATSSGVPLVKAPSPAEVKIGKTRNIKFTVTNSGTVGDAFTLKLIQPSTAGKKVKPVVCAINGIDVTTALKAGTYNTGQLAAGASVTVVVKVTPRAKGSGVYRPKISAQVLSGAISQAQGQVTIVQPKEN